MSGRHKKGDMTNFNDTVIYSGGEGSHLYWGFVDRCGDAHTEKRREFIDKMTHDVLSLHHPDIARDPRHSKCWAQISTIKSRAYETRSREKVLVFMNELRLIK